MPQSRVVSLMNTDTHHSCSTVAAFKVQRKKSKTKNLPRLYNRPPVRETSRISHSSKLNRVVKMQIFVNFAMCVCLSLNVDCNAHWEPS